MNKLYVFVALVALAVVITAFSCVPASRATGGALEGADGVTSAPAIAEMSARVNPAALPAALGYEDLARLLADTAAGIRLLDVRAADEFSAGRIPGAVLAPYDALSATFAEADKAAPIVVYCRSGRRSAIAKATLNSMGYTNVSDFGGIDNWKGALEK